MSTPAAEARVAVLVSGRGSNLQALIDAQGCGALDPRARLVVVISNVADAPALALARRAGIAAVACPSRGLAARAHEAQVLACLAEHGARVACLAGYMRRLSAEFVDAFPGPILNVHPSLLPAFPGLHAQQQAWAHGVKVSGATVHLVDAGLDTGPIILQQAVAVRDDDDVESLSARILAAEHDIYPRALSLVVSERVRVVGRRTRVNAESRDAGQKTF